MDRITIIGLGNMGRAIARTLADAGLEVCVWNRSEKAALALQGSCKVAPNLGEALAAGDIVIAVLSDYDVTTDMLAPIGEAGGLAGKCLIQLATGSAAQARVLARQCAMWRAGYLDGKIHTYPARIGSKMARLGFAGDRALYDRALPILSILCGRPAFVGDDPGLSPMLDMAWLSTLYGATIGLLHALAFAKSSGLPSAAVFESLPSWLADVQGEADYFSTLFAVGDFTATQAPLSVHRAGIDYIRQNALEAGVSTTFFDFIAALMDRAIASGAGGHEIAALAESLTDPTI